MKKIVATLITLSSIFCFTLLGPQTASASSAVFRITEKDEHATVKATSAMNIGKQDETKSALYTITYTLRAFGGDMYIPLNVGRDGTPQDQGGTGYAILDSDLHTHTKGLSAGMLLSTSTIVNNMYKIPDGERRTFTLVVLYDNTGSQRDDYRIGLTRTAFKTSATSTKVESDDVSARKYWTAETFLTNK